MAGKLFILNLVVHSKRQFLLIQNFHDKESSRFITKNRLFKTQQIQIGTIIFLPLCLLWYLRFGIQLS